MNSVPRRVLPVFCLALISFGACTEVVALPSGSVRFEPPAEYEHWWRMTESCSGFRGSFSDVSWSVVPGAYSLPGTQGLNGEWFEQGNRIVVAEDAEMVGELVRHEMLHALARVSRHPRLLYLERCGGVVVCIEECITDAGPSPTPPVGALVVPPDSIDVSIEIDPSMPSGGIFGGYFTIAVIAQNRSSHAVVVHLPPSGDAGPAYAWEFSVRGVSDGASGLRGYGYRADDPEVTIFAPGETKRQLFDQNFTLSSDRDGLLAGTYVAEAAYGGHAAMPITFTVAH